MRGDRERKETGKDTERDRGKQLDSQTEGIEPQTETKTDEDIGKKTENTQECQATAEADIDTRAVTKR